MLCIQAYLEGALMRDQYDTAFQPWKNLGSLCRVRQAERCMRQTRGLEYLLERLLKTPGNLGTIYTPIWAGRGIGC